MLVAAVLGPEEREDGQLEVVRLAAEQLPDTARLPVGQTEHAVERLIDDLRQVSQCIRGGIHAWPSRYVQRGCVGRTVILVLLALIWGASFMLIKIADRELAPATLILGRLGSRPSCSPRSPPSGSAPQADAPEPRQLAVARRRRAREHRAALLAPVLGRDAHRLRARLDHPGLRADLQRAARFRLLPRGAREADCGCSGS